MSFRRIPFQFSSSDPVERQVELEKRFGLPSGNNMYVDVANPLAKGSSSRDFNQSSSSPRLQHRVPIFVESYDQSVKSSVDSIGTNSDAKRKPNVRVVPIEIEGADPRLSIRHRTFSGPAGWVNKEESVSPREDTSPLKRSMQDLSQPSKVKVSTGPKVYNIPIHVERKSPTKSAKVSKSSSLKDHTKMNGCATSKPSNKVKSLEKPESEIKLKFEPGIEVSLALKKIENVLTELKSYESSVQEFVGTVKNKHYRYLDEMLTRCMLRLDDIETMGNDEVRSARKSAIKKVQVCIDLLETKINAEYESTNDKADTNLDDSEIQDNLSHSKDVDIEEIGECKVTPECNDKDASEITEVEMVESKEIQCEVTADSKLSNEVAELETQLRGKVLNSQTEVEMEENSSFEKEAATTLANEETGIEMITDVLGEDMNSVVPEVEMMESMSVETERLSSSKPLNEASKIDLSQNIAHSNLPEDKISAEIEFADNTHTKSEGSCCQSLDTSSTTCDIMSEVTTDTINAPNLSVYKNIEISASDKISTEL